MIFFIFNANFCNSIKLKNIKVKKNNLIIINIMRTVCNNTKIRGAYSMRQHTYEAKILTFDARIRIESHVNK